MPQSPLLQDGRKTLHSKNKRNKTQVPAVHCQVSSTCGMRSATCYRGRKCEIRVCVVLCFGEEYMIMN